MTQIRVNADSVTRCMWNIIGNHMDEKMSPFLEYLFSLHLLLLCIVCYTFLRILVIRIWCEIKQWKLYCSGKVGKGEGEMCDSCWRSSQMLEISHLIVNMYLTLTCSCTVNDAFLFNFFREFLQTNGCPWLFAGSCHWCWWRQWIHSICW